MANYATGTGNTPLIIFTEQAQRSNQIVYAPASNYASDTTDDIYDFVPVNGDGNAGNYLNESGSYIYSPPVAPTSTPAPDPFGFQIAVAEQSVAMPGGTIPNGAILFLASMVGVLNTTTLATLPYLQAVWSIALTEYNVEGGPLFGNCTDGVSIVARIEAIAAQFNCPLVATAPSS